MIFFGHVGITTAAVKAYEKISSKKVRRDIPNIDYRLVMIGAMLPDIIDKPIGAYFFRSIFHNSRIFSHSLVFSIVMIFLGSYYFYKRKNNSIFIIGICSLIHQILDSMWLYPGILYWPVFGWRFPTRPEGNWVESSLGKLLTDPYVYLPEIIGAVIVAYYIGRLILRGSIREFLRYGRL
ncbi:metal-dependent hydrolase [Clostridium magnum]|uniref:Metal-dependent hydrolase n=1 Tax=Clostridium magnum DSM 2767 TaxID=1121326 RepID=A0A162T4E4_9CLOT|nr:metal-dependent hydrolase [Clostridium magnum]KZL92230.1 hypothetical protein CLMAG_20390 [Clostridium magnum DSM 2767]SHH17038.1 LexA-binding, inner membrane-associated putative hydrolase [Clostridium magnum DSM 2767]